MEHQRQATIQSMIGAFLVASVGSTTLYSLANKGLLGEWGKYRARYTNRTVFILTSGLLAPIISVTYDWAMRKGAELEKRGKS